VSGVKALQAVRLYRWRATSARRDVLPFIALYSGVCVAASLYVPSDTTSIVPRRRRASRAGAVRDDPSEDTAGRSTL
jgi:hypothetical protein